MGRGAGLVGVEMVVWRGSVRGWGWGWGWAGATSTSSIYILTKSTEAVI